MTSILLAAAVPQTGDAVRSRGSDEAAAQIGSGEIQRGDAETPFAANLKAALQPAASSATGDAEQNGDLPSLNPESVNELLPTLSSLIDVPSGAVPDADSVSTDAGNSDAVSIDFDGLPPEVAAALAALVSSGDDDDDGGDPGDPAEVESDAGVPVNVSVPETNAPQSDIRSGETASGVTTAREVDVGTLATFEVGERAEALAPPVDAANAGANVGVPQQAAITEQRVATPPSSVATEQTTESTPAQAESGSGIVAAATDSDPANVIQSEVPSDDSSSIASAAETDSESATQAQSGDAESASRIDAGAPPTSPDTRVTIQLGAPEVGSQLDDGSAVAGTESAVLRAKPALVVTADQDSTTQRDVAPVVTQRSGNKVVPLASESATSVPDGGDTAVEQTASSGVEVAAAAIAQGGLAGEQRSRDQRRNPRATVASTDDERTVQAKQQQSQVTTGTEERGIPVEAQAEASATRRESFPEQQSVKDSATDERTTTTQQSRFAVVAESPSRPEWHSGGNVEDSAPRTPTIAPASTPSLTPQAAPTGAVARSSESASDQSLRVANQLTYAVEQAIETNARPLRMRLDPPELGSIAVEIRRDGGQVQIEVQFESARALKLASEGIDAFRETLVAKGFDVEPDQIRLQFEIGRDAKVSDAAATNNEDSPRDHESQQRDRQERERADAGDSQHDRDAREQQRHDSRRDTERGERDVFAAPRGDIPGVESPGVTRSRSGSTALDIQI